MRPRADLEDLLAMIPRVDEAAVLAALAPAGAQDLIRAHPEILHAVVEAGFSKAAAFALAIDAGCHVNAVVDGHTPLHRAVIAGDIDMTRLLLQAGADAGLRVETTARRDFNALHLATDATPAILQLVLQAATPETIAATSDMVTAHDDVLRMVLRDERADMLAVLRAFGLFFDRPGPDGLTPLHFVLMHRKSKAGGLAMLRLLEEGGADLHAVTPGGETALMLAARDGWHEAFDYLLAAGVDPAARARDGGILLHAAARGPDIGILKQALTLGLDINARNRSGETPLYLAAHRNRLAHVEVLAAAGADPHIPDRQGRTPDMVCQARVQAMTRQAVLQAQKNTPARKTRGLPRRQTQKDVRKRRIGPSKRP